MQDVEQKHTQPIGLDVGTSRIVVARATDKRYYYEAQLNAFQTLPYSKLAENLLQRENVFHEVQDSEIIVAGDDARKFAEVFHVETRRPMVKGVLNPKEPHSLAVVRKIIHKLAGRASFDGQKAFFSVPAPIPEGHGGIADHEASIRSILAVHTRLLVRNTISRSTPSISTSATIRRINSGAGLLGLLNRMTSSRRIFSSLDSGIFWTTSYARLSLARVTENTPRSSKSRRCAKST